MGIWGHNSFENDDACDWLFDLEQSKGKRAIFKSLDTVLAKSGRITSLECFEALAAAEVVYAGVSIDHSSVPEDVVNWLKKKPGLFKTVSFNSKDVIKSIEAICKILNSGELKALRKEVDDFDEWKHSIVILKEKLAKYA